MALAEVRLQKLRDLINSLKEGRDALINEGRVDKARVIDQKIRELQSGYNTILRQVETDKQLKVLTRQARDVERTYLTEMPPMGTTREIGAAPILGAGIPGAPAADKARVRRHKKKKGRR